VPLSQVGKQPSAPSAPAPGNPINPAADGSPPPSNDNAPAGAAGGSPGADATPAGGKSAAELETRLGDALAAQGAAIDKLAELIEARAAPPPEMSRDPVAAAAVLRGHLTGARHAIR
jgi:hypothetical protein